MTLRKPQLILLAIVLTPPVFIFALLMPVLIGGTHCKLVNRTEVEMRGIGIALEQYKAEFGMFPEGNGPAVFQLLYGTNPYHRDFFDPGSRTNGGGEFLDPWGSPYQIRINGRTNVLITSAGTNGVFGDKDDYVLLLDGRNAGFIQKP